MYSPRTDLSEIFDEGEKRRGEERVYGGERGIEREREREVEKRMIMAWKGGRVREGRKRERRGVVCCSVRGTVSREAACVMRGGEERAKNGVVCGAWTCGG